MLLLVLGAGIVSRLASGWICDRIGGRLTLLLGSSLQALALVLFLAAGHGTGTTKGRRRRRARKHAADHGAAGISAVQAGTAGRGAIR
jgi:nitrate/nitrite transporter NarK